jgi:hypothetical protein
MPRKAPETAPAGLAHPKPARGSARRERRSRRRTENRDSDYRAWIRTHPCVVGRECKGPVHCHHEPPRSHAGAWSDYKTVPLCQRHHDRAVPGSRHALGYPGFCARWGVDLHERVEHFNRLFEPPF